MAPVNRLHDASHAEMKFDEAGAQFFPPPASINRDCLRNLHFDSLRFGLLALGQMHPEHAVFELGDDLRAIRSVRQRKAAQEVPVRTLDAVILLVLLFLLELALAGDGENANLTPSAPVLRR